MLTWLMTVFGIRPDARLSDDRRDAARRERDLRERLARLEREVDVIQHAQTPEEPRR